MTSMSANAGPLPERVDRAAQERIAAGTYQTVVFGVAHGDKSVVVTFGKLDNDRAPDGNTVYEIGSVTKTFTATLLARAVLSGRMTLDTPAAQLLPDFKIPSRGGKEITLSELGTHHSGLPRMPSNFLPRDAANPYADYDAAKLKVFLAGYELPRDPGAACSRLSRAGCVGPLCGEWSQGGGERCRFRWHIETDAGRRRSCEH